MRFRVGVTLASLFMMCFAVALWTSPAAARAFAENGSPELASITGKILDVNETQLTLALERDQTPNKMQFTIDQNTKVQGHLTSGAQASIDYRTDNGKLIATQIVVLPASGSED
jgi:hypothetical protein